MKARLGLSRSATTQLRLESHSAPRTAWQHKLSSSDHPRRSSTTRSASPRSTSSTAPPPRVRPLSRTRSRGPNTDTTPPTATLGAAAGAATGVVRDQPAIPAAFRTAIRTGVFSFTFFSAPRLPLLALFPLPH